MKGLVQLYWKSHVLGDLQDMLVVLSVMLVTYLNVLLTSGRKLFVGGVAWETSEGRPMIREGCDFHIFIRRSLRDIFRKVPNFALKIGSLHIVVFDKEYGIITNYLAMNLGEQPNLPPPFCDINSHNSDTIRILADQVNMTSEVFL
ncbi:unnamed protein product [Lactuca saligna]|uniref:Uncharacterized protein n=1 Tax=Lactuca saligna TaxID=75948 RepID=A0AA35VSP1_LACSI|nr:unnamed protein product [Lactuca saligna]